VAGTVGEPVNEVPTVAVRDPSGHPVQGIKVIFYRTYAGGADSAMQHTVVTDSRGIASAGEWILPTRAGWYELEAFIPAFEIPDSAVVRFQAQAKATSPAVLSVAPGNEPVALPGDTIALPGVIVTDRFGNPTEASLTYSVTGGGGSLSKGTNGSGLTWTLGSSPGPNSIVASAPGLNSVTLTAHALDAGAVTWYGLRSAANPWVVNASVALGDHGIFESKTSSLDGFGGIIPVTQLGTYTLTGTKIVLAYPTGQTEEGTLVGDTLSLVRTPQSQPWSFVKRP
jgi:hypothetical protein